MKGVRAADGTRYIICMGHILPGTSVGGHAGVDYNAGRYHRCRAHGDDGFNDPGPARWGGDLTGTTVPFPGAGPGTRVGRSSSGRTRDVWVRWL